MQECGKKWLVLSPSGAVGIRLVGTGEGGGRVPGSMCLFAGDSGNVSDRVAALLIARLVSLPTRQCEVLASHAE